MKSLDPFPRFQRRIFKDSKSGCWIWKGARLQTGYGSMSVNGKVTRIHRWAYLHFIGEIPSWMDVCHRCDVRLCVNPDHLFLGSRMTNMADAKNKGRIAIGERHSQSKLTNEKVLEIKKLLKEGFCGSDLARRHGISPMAISDIKRGKTWIHA